MSFVQLIEYEDAYQQGVIDLILTIQTQEFDIPVTIKDQPDLENIPDFYQQKAGNFWVALVDKQVVGSIALIDIGNGQSALRKMFVAKAYRGKDKGIAQALMDTVMDWCRVKNISEIYLGTVSILIAAQRFYTRNGFAEIAKEDLPKAFPLMVVDTHFFSIKLN